MKITKPSDTRLTHVIICDAGQWAKGESLEDAKQAFKKMHSARSVDKAQVWAVTSGTYINEHGGFRCPRDNWVDPVRMN